MNAEQRREQRRAVLAAAFWCALAYFFTFPLVSLFGLHFGELYLWPVVAGHAASLVPLFAPSKYMPSRRGMKRIARWGLTFVLLQLLVIPRWGGWLVLDYVAGALVVYAVASHANRVLAPAGERAAAHWPRHVLYVRPTTDPWVVEARAAVDAFVQRGSKEPLTLLLAGEHIDARWVQGHEDARLPRAVLPALALAWVAWAAALLNAAFGGGGAWQGFAPVGEAWLALAVAGTVAVLAAGRILAGRNRKRRAHLVQNAGRRAGA